MVEPIHYVFGWIIIGGAAYVAGVFMFYTVVPLLMFFLGTPKPSKSDGFARVRLSTNDYDEDY